MATVDSTATLPEVKIAPPADGKDLTTVVTNNPARKPDGKNLLIEIDVLSDQAVFECQDTEHVGTHKDRRVFFCANDHCWLIFIGNSAFKEDFLELQKGEQEPAHVADQTDKAETRYKIRVSAGHKAMAEKMARTVQVPKRPPVIVVP